VAAASRKLMAEWECLLVAKASWDQQRMRVSVGIQWRCVIRSCSCTATSDRSCQDSTTTTNGLPLDDTHTEGSNGIYGPTREACWVREGVSHPPPRTECRCVHIAILRLCLYFNVSLSLSQLLSYFLHWNLLWALFRIV
jgi:hypothetical protein